MQHIFIFHKPMVLKNALFPGHEYCSLPLLFYVLGSNSCLKGNFLCAHSAPISILKNSTKYYSERRAQQNSSFKIFIQSFFSHFEIHIIHNIAIKLSTEFITKICFVTAILQRSEEYIGLQSYIHFSRTHN